MDKFDRAINNINPTTNNVKKAEINVIEAKGAGADTGFRKEGGGGSG